MVWSPNGVPAATLPKAGCLLGLVAEMKRWKNGLQWAGALQPKEILTGI
jgi:hypothetical protein